jgi:CBS domain-containing protein
MQAMRVSAFMSSPVISIAANTRLPQIKNLMAQHHIRRVPVLQPGRLTQRATIGCDDAEHL